MLDYWREWRGVRLKVMRDNGGVITFGRPSAQEWQEIEAMEAEGLIERVEADPGYHAFRLRVMPERRDTKQCKPKAP